MNINILKEFKKRNLIQQISDENNINYLLNNKKINIYCGFDPTNDSLHIGHLIPLISLQRFKKYGYRIIILIGEITSNIGDPSYRINKRQNENITKIKLFTKKIKLQINNFFHQNKKKNEKKNLLINNSKWFKDMKIIFFLKEIGQYFPINNILNKEFIKLKNNVKNKQGISFSEISYNILQSYDFAYLFKNLKVKLQIGGSDQWGNITSGINLIKKLYNKKAYGLTLPLMLNKNGKKFSKTENKTLWLDPKKTTPYEFYQYWLNIPDKNLFTLLKQLTFLSLKEIKNIKKKKDINFSKKILAQKITKIVHGKQELKSSIISSKIFFLNNIENIKKEKINKLFKKNIPKFIIKNTFHNIKDILILLKIVKSKTQAHNLIINKAISINNINILNTNYLISDQDKLYNKYTLIKKGKKNFFLIKWIN